MRGAALQFQASLIGHCRWALQLSVDRLDQPALSKSSLDFIKRQARSRFQYYQFGH
jgi:hypothetical protein